MEIHELQQLLLEMSLGKNTVLYTSEDASEAAIEAASDTSSG